MFERGLQNVLDKFSTILLYISNFLCCCICILMYSINIMSLYYEIMQVRVDNMCFILCDYVIRKQLLVFSKFVVLYKASSFVFLFYRVQMSILTSFCTVRK